MHALMPAGATSNSRVDTKYILGARGSERVSEANPSAVKRLSL